MSILLAIIYRPGIQTWNVPISTAITFLETLKSKYSIDEDLGKTTDEIPKGG